MREEGGREGTGEEYERKKGKGEKEIRKRRQGRFGTREGQRFELIWEGIEGIGI